MGLDRGFALKAQGYLGRSSPKGNRTMIAHAVWRSAGRQQPSPALPGEGARSPRPASKATLCRNSALGAALLYPKPCLGRGSRSRMSAFASYRVNWVSPPASPSHDVRPPEPNYVRSRLIAQVAAITKWTSEISDVGARSPRPRCGVRRPVSHRGAPPWNPGNTGGVPGGPASELRGAWVAEAADQGKDTQGDQGGHQADE